VSQLPYHIAAVSFLNTRPMIEGLDARTDVELHLAVPARLLDLLQSGQNDVALLPAIDYQRADNLVMLPGCCIGADGAALTVRVFSRVKIAQIRTLRLDTESHTSNALARILLSEVYGIRPTISDDGADAMVYIGDKVVTRPPADMPYDIDLGQVWKEWTGLPFVFAAWQGPRDRISQGLVDVLLEARRCAMERIDAIVQQFAIPHQWPRDLARRYFLEILQYELDLSPGSPQRRAIERFHQLAARHGIIPSPARPLEVFQP
jgi:chorismate dehydratase